MCGIKIWMNRWSRWRDCRRQGLTFACRENKQREKDNGSWSKSQKIVRHNMFEKRGQNGTDWTLNREEKGDSSQGIDWLLEAKDNELTMINEIQGKDFCFDWRTQQRRILKWLGREKVSALILMLKKTALKWWWWCGVIFVDTRTGSCVDLHTKHLKFFLVSRNYWRWCRNRSESQAVLFLVFGWRDDGKCRFIILPVAVTVKVCTRRVKSE